MRKLRVLIVTHDSTLPPPDAASKSDKEMLPWKSEFDLFNVLTEIGHECEFVGLSDDLSVLRHALEELKPHVCFNLIEEFNGVALYDQNVISYLELLKQPYTGCNPRGLMLSHDKVLSKKIMAFHRIPTAPFVVIPLGLRVREPKNLHFPLVVKSSTEHASKGISQSSIVGNFKRLKERVEFVHDQIGTDALVEEYVDGRELYVGIIGNRRLEVFPTWEADFSRLPDNVFPIATERVKWDLDYQERHGFRTGRADGLDEAIERRVVSVCKRVYKRLHMTGYARLDLRLRSDGSFAVLEANANPNISFGEDFAESAEAAGYSYRALLQKILNLGLSYQPAWKRSNS